MAASSFQNLSPANRVRKEHYRDREGISTKLSASQYRYRSDAAKHAPRYCESSQWQSEDYRPLSKVSLSLSREAEYLGSMLGCRP